LHDAPAVAVLTRDLSDLRWGSYAAEALCDIWSADHLPKDKRITGRTDFSQSTLPKAQKAT
jgi:hypothetical protein